MMTALIGNAIALFLVVLLVAVCARELVKGHKSGGCAGGCAGCSGSCAGCSGSCAARMKDTPGKGVRQS